MSEWQPIETAPKDGSWFLVLVPVTTVKVDGRPYMSPDLRVIHRYWNADALGAERVGEGCWHTHYGSVADSYVARALWAPLDALPLAEAYSGFASIPSPLPEAPK